MEVFKAERTGRLLVSHVGKFAWFEPSGVFSHLTDVHEWEHLQKKAFMKEVKNFPKLELAKMEKAEVVSIEAINGKNRPPTLADQFPELAALKGAL